MLNVVKFLKSYTDVDVALTALTDKFAIHVCHSIKYPQLVQLKYDQLDSPMSNEIVQECRGIILDSSDDWKIIAFPFKKFFNYGDVNCDEIDWRTATSREKLDGSMMFLYYYNDEWLVASSGMPDARGPVRDQDFTMSELFWNTWNDLGYKLPPNPSVHPITYIFEMVTPYNVLIVPHKNSRLVLIGARNTVTLNETSIDIIPVEWEKARKFSIRSIDEAIEVCQAMNPMEQEGFVIVDHTFNRIKIKTPQYVAISLLGLTKEEILSKGHDLTKYDEKLQKRRLLSIILTNEHAEFLTYYPQYYDMYWDLHKKYMKLIYDAECLYEANKNAANHLEFARAVGPHPLSSMMFSMKQGKVNSIVAGVRQWYNKRPSSATKQILTLLK